MLTRRDALLLSLGAASTRLGYSKDFWLEKKPAEWSEKDVEKMLNHSPWAKEVYAELNMGGGGMGRGGGRGMPNAESSSSMGGGDMSTMGSGGGGVGGPGGGAGGGGGRRGGGGGGGGMEGGGVPQIKGLIRWETAPPVRAAAKTALPKEVAEHYAISLSTQAMAGMMGGGGGQRRGEPPAGADAADPEARRKAMLQRLGQSTTLQRKGKDPIHPEHVLTGKDPARMFVLFLFPRDAQPITLEDKEVMFVSKMGPAEFKTKFTLKDMVYDGKLDL